MAYGNMVQELYLYNVHTKLHWMSLVSVLLAKLSMEHNKLLWLKVRNGKINDG